MKVLGNISSMLSIDLGVDIYETGIENIKLKGKILNLANLKLIVIEKIAEFSELGEHKTSFINVFKWYACEISICPSNIQNKRYYLTR